MKERGILIERHDPQPEVRKNAETATDWEFKDEAKFLYDKAVLFRDRLIDPVLLTTRDRVSDPVISFENLRNHNVLAAYTLRRNPQGLLYEITFNTEHYIDQEGKKVWEFGRWAQMETLTHEQVHLWQQNAGKNPVKPGKSTHNREFIEKCEQIGLHPMPGVGCHTDVASADSPFGIIMKELGIERPDDVPRSSGKFDWFEGPTKRKGTSSLHKWTCPECGLNARMGIKGDPRIIHEPCSEKKGELVFFVRAIGMLGLSENVRESDSPEAKNRGGDSRGVGI